MKKAASYYSINRWWQRAPLGKGEIFIRVIFLKAVSIHAFAFKESGERR